MANLLDLFLTFARIGALTFGGGYAMLPMLESEVVNAKRWATKEELMDYFAIGQCTPGIIAVNTATFIGYKQRKIIGAIAATLGVVAPSVVIISIIAAFLQNFASYPVIARAMPAIRVVVGAMVANAVIKLWKSGVKTKIGGIIAALSFIVSAVFGVSPVALVLLGAVLGIVLPTKFLEVDKNE